MNKHIGICSFLISIISCFHMAKAEEVVNEKTQRIMHYEAVLPINKNDAEQQFKNGLSKIDIILQNEKIGRQELENIHEITYSLEAALTPMKPLNKHSDSFMALTEEVETIHLASENHQEEKTRDSFAKVKALSEEVFSE